MQLPDPNAPEGAEPIRLQVLVQALALALMLGWLLVIGRQVLVPMVLAVMLAYVVVGVAGLMRAVPGVGRIGRGGCRYTTARPHRALGCPPPALEGVGAAPLPSRDPLHCGRHCSGAKPPVH